MITFEETTHTYQVDGRVVPSQSEIVRYFFRDEYLPPQHILDYAAEKGTAIHKAIELYEKDDLGELPQWLEPYLEQWKVFRKGHGNIILQEKFLYSPTYDFCGTVDLLFSPGLVCDIKSGQKYLKHRLQTAMYLILCQDNKIPAFSRGCLYIKEDSLKFDPHEDESDIDLVKAMIKIFHWFKKNNIIKGAIKNV